MWDYAELAKAAKEVGGPEKLVETIFEHGETVGVVKMIPIVVIGSFCGYAIAKLVEFIKKKYKASKEEGEKAKRELIAGILDYQKAHPETSDPNPAMA